MVVSPADFERMPGWRSSMAKKKRQPPRKGPKHPPSRGPNPRARSEAERPAQLPDRRTIEGVMRGFPGELLGPAEETPLAKAQELAYQAVEEPDLGKRTGLANQALALSPRLRRCLHPARRAGQDP